MNFSDYIIDESDYEFFESLPHDEKLLFLYDLICDDVYGAGSVEPMQFTEPVIGVYEFESMLKDFENKLYSIVAASINDKAKVNILFINNRVILNSESLYELNDAIQSLFLDGYILQEHELNNNSLSIFHQQRYCKAFNIIGQSSRISFN
jgi:hypothetical protein